MNVENDTFELFRNASNQWVYVTALGHTHEDVRVVRAFPITQPTQGIAVVSAAGHELRWIPSLDDLTPSARQQIEQALASSEFMPEILQIKKVSTFNTPSVWEVITDRGETSFTLKGEENIRRLAGQALLIDDLHGIYYLIRNMSELDRHSRRLLDHFL
jgi:hypothetical protein